jgi:hypothetical protein
VIEDPAVASKILECLRLPARAPPPAPATAGRSHAEFPADDDDFFDQSSVREEPW